MSTTSCLGALLTPEQAEAIIQWLKVNPQVIASLKPGLQEIELELSRENDKGEVEYILIGIPILFEADSGPSSSRKSRMN